MRCTTAPTTRVTRSVSPATDVIRKVLSVAVATGVAVGLIIALVLQVTTTPLILKAEVYEKAAHVSEGKSVASATLRAPSAFLLAHEHSAAPAAGAASKHEDEGWQPAEGLQRTAATSIATIAVAIGYALLLLGCMIIARVQIDARTGLFWGAAAFVAFGLAPALGLAPELPGSAAADLLQRQLWWGATTLASGIGLYLLAFKPQITAKAAGVALLLAPHMIGAPQPTSFESTAPAELAAGFAAASLVVHALLWCLVGLGVGWCWTRFDRSPARNTAVPA